ncbi:MAG TPA: GNAT family N-acetyltransferase, partial [Syntrophomonas sp.]|nr:GNAT family N-acetyltransferase [Syntrophomonas sp.]
GELALFDNSNYRVLAVEEKGVTQAFIAEWLLPSAHFIEHFAVSPEVRGRGLGTEIMHGYLERTKGSVVLEVETDETLKARRRIGFYERLGFILSDVTYIQPLLRKESPDVALQLMHYPAEISNRELQRIKREIFQKVYV